MLLSGSITGYSCLPESELDVSLQYKEGVQLNEQRDQCWLGSSWITLIVINSEMTGLAMTMSTSVR